VTIILTTLKKILFWSYDRGTWQYDVMCVLILAFVFFAPNRAFQNRPQVPAVQPSSIFIGADDIPAGDSIGIEREITRQLSEKYGYEVTLSGIEPMMDRTGKLRGYLTHISADRATARDSSIK
jgi:hypothetical protein